jgi:hypothetical protein
MQGINRSTLSGMLIKRGVILLSGEFDDINHPKFFVVMGTDGSNILGYFFINSNITGYIESKKDFMDMQVFIKHSDYPDILQYDSFIGCHELSKISKSRLTEQIQNNLTSFKGELRTDDLERLLENLRNSKLYSKIEKETFFK